MDEGKTVEADFDFTVELLSAFFSQARVRSTLAKIVEAGVTGWEKWWQVELAMYLSEHPEIADWDLEVEFLTDRRRSTAKDFMAIDLCYRRKRHAGDHLIFLELKQDEDWKRCIGNMLRDAEKFGASQSRSLSGASVRSFFLVGVYTRVSKGEVHDYIEEAAERHEVDWDVVETRFIADTDLAFTVL